MVKAILFDCFGVIITDAMELVVQRADPAVRERISDIVRANNRGLLEPSESNRMIAELLGVTPQELRSQIDKGEVKNTEVTDWIKELRRHYKTALLSNIGRGSMKRRFSEAELQGLFDAVIISGDIGLAKPDTEIYRYAATQLGLAPQECVFVDDRQGHCDGAVVAGMQPLLFTSYQQARRELQKYLQNNANGGNI